MNLIADQSPLGPLPRIGHSPIPLVPARRGLARALARRPVSKPEFGPHAWTLQVRRPKPKSRKPLDQILAGFPQPARQVDAADPYSRPTGQLRRQADLGRYQQNAPALASLLAARVRGLEITRPVP
jgi:hypothetical protein